jgi:ATPase subunit of ABC transporter with duplicated ATPase domains
MGWKDILNRRMVLMVLVELSDVSKGFGKRLLYQDVNLKIKVNDKVALIGPNGSGKTTPLLTRQYIFRHQRHKLWPDQENIV